MASKANAPKHSRILKWVILHPTRVLAFFVLLLYFNTLFNGYNLDDELVTRNHKLTSKGIGAIPEIFKMPYYSDDMGYAYEYRPVVLATFSIEHQLFGESPVVSHTINLLLYVLLIFILYKSLLSLFRELSPQFAFIIALFFAVHPIHTEVVASIKCRDELLALLFGLFSLFSALKFVDKQKWYWLIPTTAAFVLGVLSKQSIVSFAVLIPVALVLIRPLKLSQLLQVLAVLLIPLYPLLSVKNPLDKLGFIVSGLTFVLFLQCLRHFQWHAFFTLIKKNFVPQQYVWERTVSNWKSKLDLIRAHQKFELGHWFLAFILSILLFFLLHRVTNSVMLIVLSAFYMVGIAWIFLRDSTLLVFPLVLFSAYYLSAIDKIDGETMQNFIYIILITMVVMSKNKFEILLATLLYLIIYILIVIKFSSFPPQIFAYGLMMGLAWNLKSKYVPILIVVSLVFEVVYFFVEYFAMGIPINKISGNVTIALFLITLLLLNRRLYRSAVILNFTVIFLLTITHPFVSSIDNHNKQQIATTLTNLSVASNNLDASFLPQSTDRPLHFVEVPVTAKNDQQTRIGTSLVVLLKYLKLTIVPYPMCFYYGYSVIKPTKFYEPLALISLALFGIITALSVWSLRRHPILSFGLLVYLISIATFSSYFIYMPGMLADRNLFIPTLGFSIVLGYILLITTGMNLKTFDLGKTKIYWRYGVVGLVFIYSIITIRRNFDWINDLTLFRHDIKYVSESAQANNLLALHLMQHASSEQNGPFQNDLVTEALVHFKKAKEIYPSFFNVAYDIGRVYSGLNKQDSAIAYFEYALTIDTLFPDIYFNLGDLYFTKNNLEKSNNYFSIYIRKVPNDYKGYNKLSYGYFLMKKYEQSIEVNKNAIVQFPTLADPYINIGRTFVEMNQKDSARLYLYKARDIDPNNQTVQATVKNFGF